METKSGRKTYMMLTPEEKQKRIIATNDKRKKRQNGESSSGCNKQAKSEWFQMSQTYLQEEDFNIKFQSPIHQLKKLSSCKFCGALRFEHECPTFCCYNGQVRLATQEVPDDLYFLYASQTEEGILFRKNIRAYNSIFSFTSLGVKLDENLASSKKGVYTFKAQGQIYHDLPALLPEEKPMFFQLYFYDTSNEMKNRIEILKNVPLNEGIIARLMRILTNNPYAIFFRSLGNMSTIANLHIHIAGDVRIDQRVYNAPTTDQVAAIWIEGNDNNIPFKRDIIVHAHSGNRHRVQHYYSCYDPLQYPLLSPLGEVGWHQDIARSVVLENKNRISDHLSNVAKPLKIWHSADDIIQNEQQGVLKGSSTKVSCREYYCYKLQIRELEKSILFRSGRLLQQYIVDMYIKLETTRLDFYRTQQSHIRSELYQGIVDIVNAGETRGNKVGKRIVLPASFVGGPRDMRRRYLDAMALVQHFGKPDLFITMTCNAEWKEIKDELIEGQHPPDRPDLTSRVFRGKLMDLKDQIVKKEIFGKVAAFVYVIEFQKRGLPHAHMLIIFNNSNKIVNADQYDKYVQAEIPDKEHNPNLYNVVIKHMLHGPCGEDNNKSPCMVNEACRFHYPRAFSTKTVQGKDAYPIYKRRNNGNKVKVRNANYDNRWVVPYNPYLLLRYNCHINVEICSGLKAVKYLYKYIYKGHDRASVYISHDDDDSKTINEIKEFQDARWVSAQEALWRIYDFRLHEISPAVINLQLHLPNNQIVTYWENQNLENIIKWDHVSKTMLTEYFELCKNCEVARKYLYKEIPEHYVWNKQARIWTKRKKCRVIARIAGANPAEGERYYLRLLLNHVKGPTSFQYLMIINEKKCSTFKEAAQERGLLESDQSIIECLDEATTFQMPNTFRRLFATLLAHCEPTDVRKLWESYFDALSEDYARENDTSLEFQIQSTLNDVRTFLEAMGKKINMYDLPKMNDFLFDQRLQENKHIRDEQSIEILDQDVLMSFKLNDEQKYAYDLILNRVYENKSGLFFVDGPGGTGKTFLYRALLANIRSKGMIALATATSGVAASILPGGRTAHSRFNIPLNANDSTICMISKQSGRAELLRRAKIIIWDEAPMAKRYTIETVDRTLRDIMDVDEPFGGKLFVFGGDFRQVLPVVPRATRQQTVAQSLVKSYLWEKMQKLKLSKNMRAQEDNEFAKYLIKVGNGSETTVKEDFICIEEDMVIKNIDKKTAELDLIHFVFTDLAKHASSSEYITQRAILSTTNENVDHINAKMIDIFPGEAKEFMSYDEAIDDTNNYYQEEFLNSLLPNGLPPHKLILKKNCPIMLLRNLDPSNGLCNGTRMVCRDFRKHLIYAEITMGQHVGKKVFIPRIPLSPANDEGYPFKFKRKQFPLRLSFAMTINKAQGQTIQHVGIYLPHHVFSHGQLYVALSRGISKKTTKVLLNSNVGNITKNIVYKEVLI